jgi:hypothetical protein
MNDLASTWWLLGLVLAASLFMLYAPIVALCVGRAVACKQRATLAVPWWTSIIYFTCYVIFIIGVIVIDLTR